MRVTVRHYYDFGADRAIVGTDLTTPESWDRLRVRTSGAFSIPPTRQEFIQAAEVQQIADQARAIDAWLTDRVASSVGSYGVGGCVVPDAQIARVVWSSGRMLRLRFRH